MTTLYESDVEQLAINLLQEQGYTHLPPEVQEAERGSPTCKSPAVKVGKWMI